jgi:formate hydrogenlyase subunit 6/NADH:ubiquinone oxidoreductase subunit I
MKKASLEKKEQFVVERKNFPDLITGLSNRGYQILGPTVREGTIVYDELTSVDDLPIGITDEQNGGAYRLQKRRDQALFGYAVGPHSWKKFLHPPKLLLWRARRNHSGFQMEAENTELPKLAFIGVRPCELQAIGVQDKVFINSQFVDAAYQSRRKKVFLMAVNCTHAGGTCFCASMNAGPKATAGFDLAFTEILENDRHYFVAEMGSELGAEILAEVQHREANSEEVAAAERAVTKTAKTMGRQLDTSGIKDLLYRNYEHPHWEEVAARCLTCTNCTMVCPTCFCTTVEDVTDLQGEVAERWRKWDSCFTLDFSYIHGGSVRNSAKARYRQWLIHKLATWQDQFGTSGCVGCGRCITWCPVGIDITAEVKAIRENGKKR